MPQEGKNTKNNNKNRGGGGGKKGQPQPQQPQPQQQRTQGNRHQSTAKKLSSTTSSSAVTTTTTIANTNKNKKNRTGNKRILLLHGNRQTGQLLAGRLEKLRKRIKKEFDIEFIAPDAPLPHPENENLRTWWNRVENKYEGLDDTLQLLSNEMVKTEKKNDGEYEDSSATEIVGIMGFSQGARLTHLLAMLHMEQPNKWFPKLKFVIFVAGYDAPIPDGFPVQQHHNQTISLPSLHVWGLADPLISPEQSQSLCEHYQSPQTYIHEGKHYVPSKAPDVQVFVDFIQQQSMIPTSSSIESFPKASVPSLAPPPSSSGSKNNEETVDSLEISAPKKMEETPPKSITPEIPSNTKNTTALHTTPQIPDEECAMMQQDEVQALDAIFSEEIKLKSPSREDYNGEIIYEHPIIYDIQLLPTEESLSNRSNTNWPVLPLTLRVTYPHNYPVEAIPIFKLQHENNIAQFPRCRMEKFNSILHETANMELGMPCVLSCVYAVKEYLDSPPDDDINTVGQTTTTATLASMNNNGNTQMDEEIIDRVETDGQCTIKRSSAEQIAKCSLEGLEIAEKLLQRRKQKTSSSTTSSSSATTTTTAAAAATTNTTQETASSTANIGKGGSFWTYTIGLVGKPSAGKSTFFNAATAFSRQRGEKEGDTPEWGGASMAAHPFTTIDPNIGYCLVPAPEGSCPEDDITDGNNDDDSTKKRRSQYGSTHGRDPQGRRFLPVLLKDVAGLVPGAYQGRGRGNQFLNDLCDATVLIHVVDVSGTADAQGNITVTDGEGDYTNPIDDLAWIRNELVEWVYSNLMQKWSSIIRKGQAKLSGMFSGYGQNQAMTQSIFSALDKFLEERYNRDKALDNIALWDQGDVHRIVSAFLGVRFPMALALNKLDLPSSRKHVDEIQEALPIHGAHAATPLAARSEMTFVRNHLVINEADKFKGHEKPPTGVWECLTSAMMLREPVLVFPVADMTTYAPLPGMNKDAVGHPSLPSQGMIKCIHAAGGSLPSCWRGNSYAVTPSKDNSKTAAAAAAVETKLRDVLLMKPGSTVDDVFQTLKKLGALGGEFVRAEGAGKIGDKPKPVPKHALIGKENRIIKIMSNKRTTWQS